MKNELGDRMKDYEQRTRSMLPRRSNIMIRIDGKSFHTYTKGLNKPFDFGLMEDMAETTKYLCSKIQGAKMGYTQSDEISILLTDYDSYRTDAWFNGQVQKIVSVAASMATNKFNSLRLIRMLEERDSDMLDVIESIKNLTGAEFDARVYTLPDGEEVVNYFIWRQQDATRNSISMAAQAYFSHKELQNVNTGKMQDMLMTQKEINWNDYPVIAKRGWAVKRQEQEWVRPKDNKSWKPRKVISLDDCPADAIMFKRNAWEIDREMPILTKDREYVLNVLPQRKELWK
ncbi:MAG TPA: tRNA(His) guanylyltransferase Thg1 family protein [Bacteroidales bacterium]|nr:tRNA(His) guanylyltransferase Thg1 family protein [Bacteroidales bacterium]